MTLREQQSLFVRLAGQLIAWTYAQPGLELTFGECYRTPEQAALNAKTGAGISNSLHTQRLAIDLLLFKDGKYIDKSELYEPLGTYWKSLNPLCCWGGDFHSRPDGNHFSMTWGGVK